MVPYAPTSTAVVVSELFPPAVGGSAVLLGNVYSRITSARVVVLADGDARVEAGAQPLGLRVLHQPICASLRGVMARGSIRQHARLARGIRELCRERPALIHAARALPEGIAALGCKLLTGVPYVCWCHGEEVATALTSREFTVVMRQVYAHSAAIIANSSHTRRLLNGVGVASDKITVVHPGVDGTRFRPDAEGRDEMRRRLAPGAELLVLSVGRLQRRKGHDLAIEAIALLISDFPGMRYVIVGDGEERARLEEMVAARNLLGRVIFAGEVPDVDLPACYAACDIFLLPNRADGADIEGFGIVFLEAAAAGKPAIGGRSGGVPEAIEDGATGLLVGGTDAGELAERIRTLAASATLRGQLGGAGRTRALLDFTWERAAAAVTALHERLAA